MPGVGQKGGWSGLAKQFGAVTVGYKCRWRDRLGNGRRRLGRRLGPRKGGKGGASTPSNASLATGT